MSTVTYDITSLHRIHIYTITNATHSTGRVRKSYTKSRIYTHNKTRAVCSVCQTRSTINIRIANELGCITYNC